MAYVGVMQPRNMILSRRSSVIENDGVIRADLPGSWKGLLLKLGQQNDFNRCNLPERPPDSFQLVRKKSGRGRLVGRTKGLTRLKSCLAY